MLAWSFTSWTDSGEGTNTARLFESVIEIPSTRTLLVRTGPPAIETWELAFWSCMRPIFGLLTNTTVCASLATKNGFRPRMGRSVIFWLSMTCPVDASEVSSGGASPVTLTCSVTWPSSSVRSTVTAACVEITTPLRSMLLKPVATALTVYVAGVTAVNTYSP